MNQTLWKSKKADNLFSMSLKVTAITTIILILTLFITNDYTTALSAISLIATVIFWLSFINIYMTESSINRDLNYLEADLATSQLCEIDLDQNRQISSLFYLDQKYFANIKDRGYSLVTTKYKNGILLYRVWFDRGEQGIYVVNEILKKQNNYTLFTS